MDITVLSYLTLGVVFPDALADIKDASMELIESSPGSAEIKARQIEQVEATTAGSQAVMGGIGTLITSLIVGAIAAIWLRRK